MRYITGPKRHKGDTDVCQICGGAYLVRSGNQRYCPSCASLAPRSKAAKPPAVCDMCGAPLQLDARQTVARCTDCRRARRKEYMHSWYLSHKEERQAQRQAKRQETGGETQ